jgi:hypothetical protein
VAVPAFGASVEVSWQEAPMPTRDQIRARLSALYIEAPRDVYFEAVRAAITEYYLVDPSNPYQQSGTSSGPERWKETRHCIRLVRA